MNMFVPHPSTLQSHKCGCAMDEECALWKVCVVWYTNIANAYRFTIVQEDENFSPNTSSAINFAFNASLADLLHWSQSHFMTCQCDEIIQLLLNASQTLFHSIKSNHLAINSLHFHFLPCDGHRHYHKHCWLLQPMRSGLQHRCCCRSRIASFGPTTDSLRGCCPCGRRCDSPRVCWCDDMELVGASVENWDNCQRKEFVLNSRECSATPLNSLNPFASVRPCCSVASTRIPRTPQFALIYRCTLSYCCSGCCYCCCYLCWYFQLWKIARKAKDQSLKMGPVLWQPVKKFQKYPFAEKFHLASIGHFQWKSTFHWWQHWNFCRRIHEMI